jgi:flavin-dependent dehydrogenase
MTREIHIAGGGLAGLSLACGLRRRGVPVSLHEAADYPRHRVCGEFILGADDTHFSALGIGETLADCRIHRDCSWHVGDRLVTQRRLPMPARAISRRLLDARLAELCRSQSVNLRTGDRIDMPPTEGWVQAFGRMRGVGRWLGLKTHYQNLPMNHGLEMHLGRGGYAGLTAVEDGRVNVCALLPAAGPPAPDRIHQLPARLAAIGLEALAQRLLRAEPDPASVVGVSHFQFGYQPSVPADSAVPLGDSHSMIPPFTGAGMSMAFEAAALAVDPLVEWSEGRSSWEQSAAAIRQRLREQFRRRLRWAALLHPFVLRPAGQVLLRAGLALHILPFDFFVRALRR